MMSTELINRYCLLLSILLVSACSSHIPPEIRQPLENAPSVAEVRETTDEHLEKNIRWGGVIIDIENKQETSWLTVLAFPVDGLGEPMNYKSEQGRFIAIVDQFLEPTLYSKDREVTVTGKLLRIETRKVGEFPYPYPIVQVEQLYLWAAEPEPSTLDYPPYWWHDPFYSPYYPYHPHYWP